VLTLSTFVERIGDSASIEIPGDMGVSSKPLARRTLRVLSTGHFLMRRTFIAQA
jgi:hypothetical protein